MEIGTNACGAFNYIVSLIMLTIILLVEVTLIVE